MRIGIQFAVEGFSYAHLVFENRLSPFSFKNSMSSLARASFQHQQPQPFSQRRSFSSRSLNLRANGPPPSPRSLRFHRRSPLLHQHFSYAFKLPRIIHIKSESLARQPAPLHNPIRVIPRIV